MKTIDSFFAIVTVGMRTIMMCYNDRASGEVTSIRFIPLNLLLDMPFTFKRERCAARRAVPVIASNL